MSTPAGRWGWPASRSARPSRLWSPPCETMTSMLPFALEKIQDEYLLFAVAGLVALCAFVGLILVPAVSAYGRIWEKAAAGVLAVVVLAALILVGVVIGLLVVYYYNDLVDL